MTAGLRALVVAAMVVGAVGCRSEAETFSLKLTWSQTGAQACPAGADEVASCADIAVTCGAKMLIQIVPDDDGAPLYRHCYDLPATLDACAVGQIDIVPSNPIPNEMVRVQVAVWSAEQLIGRLPEDNDGCPTDVLFDDFGQPRIDMDMGMVPRAIVPSLGGEIYFPVGDRHVAEVELGCPQYDLLDTADCRLGDPIVEATILEPVSWGRIEDPDALDDAKFGKATPDLLGGWRLASADLDPLMFSGGAEAVWQGQVRHDLPALGCLQLDPSEPESTNIAVCADMPDVFNGTPIAIESYLVDKALLAKVLRSKGLTQFPADGLVVGFIIDHLRRPAANARVTPMPGITVEYPSADFSTTAGEQTSENGMFVSSDAALPDAIWTAAGLNGVGVVASKRGGRIFNHVTVVVLQLTPPLGGEPDP